MTEKRSGEISGKTKSAGKPRGARCFFRREEGQSAFEFVLVLPVFIAAFLMVVDLGVLMYQYVSVSNAVREGARYGAINCGDGSCTDEEVKKRVIARSGGILSDDAAGMGDVLVEWMDNPPTNSSFPSRGDSVVVRINHRYDFLFFPGGMNVTSCADMSLEQADQTVGLPSTIDGC